MGDDWTLLYLSSHGQAVLDHDVVSSAVYFPLLPFSQLVVDYLCLRYLWSEILHAAYLQVIEIVPL